MSSFAAAASFVPSPFPLLCHCSFSDKNKIENIFILSYALFRHIVRTRHEKAHTRLISEIGRETERERNMITEQYVPKDVIRLEI